MAKNDKSKRLFVRVAIDIWEELEEEVLNKLTETMVHRLEVVVEAKGWYTKYWIRPLESPRFDESENPIFVV